jgi:hypothetical protein
MVGEIKEFTFYLIHDLGKVRIKTTGTDKMDAARKIAKAEKCPLSAIVFLKKRKNGKSVS